MVPTLKKDGTGGLGIGGVMLENGHDKKKMKNTVVTSKCGLNFMQS